MNLLSRLFAGVSSRTPEPGRVAPPVSLHLLPDATFALPDWQRVAGDLAAAEPGGVSAARRTDAARQWLQALQPAFGAKATVSESEHFLALAGAAANVARAALAYAEKSRGRVLRLLDGISSPDGGGKPAILVFDDADDYVRYLRHFFPQVSEYAFPGAMFVDPGHPQFVLTASTMGAAEPVIARELTRLHLAHLVSPLWLREGLALTLERMLAPRRSCCAGATCDPRLTQRASWTPERLQRFWSGASFAAGDAAAELSGELAVQLVAVLGRDRDAFVRFANAAQPADGGEAAAVAHCGRSLAAVAAEVLEEGDWAPRPGAWSSAVAGSCATT